MCVVCGTSGRVLLRCLDGLRFWLILDSTLKGLLGHLIQGISHHRQQLHWHKPATSSRSPTTSTQLTDSAVVLGAGAGIDTCFWGICWTHTTPSARRQHVDINLKNSWTNAPWWIPWWHNAHTVSVATVGC